MSCIIIKEKSFLRKSMHNIDMLKDVLNRISLKHSSNWSWKLD